MAILIRARPPCGGWEFVLLVKLFVSRAALAHD